MDLVQTDGSSGDPEPPAACALWPVDLKLTHVDCNPDDTLVHFQGQHVGICELDYNILQVEIQNAPKSAVGPSEVGDVCLVEDVLSGRWFRGRVQNRSRGAAEVFLLDHGNVLTVEPEQMAQAPEGLLALPPRVVSGFVADVLPARELWDAASGGYFSSLVGSRVRGHVQGLLPHRVLIVEVPEVTAALLRLDLGRHIDTQSFLFLVEMLVEAPVRPTSRPIPDLLLGRRIAREPLFEPRGPGGSGDLQLPTHAGLDVGEKKLVYVTAAVSAGLFYCRASCTVKDVEAMSEKLAVACGMGGVGSGPGENLGLLCAIKGKDLKWHRGFVQCLPVNSRVRVVFVDQGYCESVGVGDIHPLPPEFLMMPVGVFPCSLACLAAARTSKGHEETKNRQLLLLRQGLLGKELRITVNGLGEGRGVYEVTLGTVARDAPMYPEQKVRNGEVPVNQRSSGSADGARATEAQSDSVPLDDYVEGYVFEGYVEYARSPGDFWMRTAARNAHFEAMMGALTAHFGALRLDERVLEDPMPGAMCCAMYKGDLHYYRARVLEALADGAEVFFVDFGNTERVPGALIKELPEEFAQEPAFAMECCLAHVTPASDVWTAAATTLFHRATQGRVVQARVVCRGGRTMVVELSGEGGAEGSGSVAQLLVRERVAEYWGRDPDLEAALEGVAETPAPHVNLGPAAVEEFKPQRFQPGEELTVRCTYISSPSDFWCQNTEHRVDLDNLNERLQAFYRTNAPALRAHAACCAVRVQPYDRWYRGRVTARRTPDVEVTLVDYGSVVRAKPGRLRALMPEFLALESQAFPCSLYDLIGPVGGRAWPAEATALLKDFVSMSPLLTCELHAQLVVAGRGSHNVVDLRSPIQRATAYLVGKGVALEIPRPTALAPPRSFVYSSFGLGPGDTELVYCTHAASPQEVYLQLDRNMEVMERLSERTAMGGGDPLRRKGAGRDAAVCLAKYLGDGRWYRSLVHPAKSGRHFNVFFVDFGNKQVTEAENVSDIPRDAADLLFTPMQALRCSLDGVPEGEHAAEVDAWLEEAVLGRTLRAHFVSANGGGRFVCRLLDGQTDVGERVRELCGVRSRAGAGSGCVTGVGAGSVGVTGAPPDPGKTLIKRSSKQPCPKNSPKMKPHYQRARGKNTYGTKPIAQIRKVSGERDTALASFKEPPAAIAKLSDLPGTKLAPGFRDVGFVSHSSSSDNFFIQLETDEPRILKMVEELNAGALEPVSSEVHVGDLVAAVYEEDRSLYRAVVTDVAPGGALKVEFIDYGNTAVVDQQKVFHLASRFLTESRLSIRCTLCKPHDCQGAQSLTAWAQNKPLTVEFVQNLGTAWEVRAEILDRSLEVGADGSTGVPAVDRARLSFGLSLNEYGTYSYASESPEVQGPNLQLDRVVIGPKDNPQSPHSISQPQSPNSNSQPQSPHSINQPQSIPITVETRRRVRPRRSYSTKRNQRPGMPIPESESPDQTDKNPRTQPKVVVNNMHDDDDALNRSGDFRRLSPAPVRTGFVCCGFAVVIVAPDEFYVFLEDSLPTLSAVSAALRILPRGLPPLPESRLVPGAGCLLEPGGGNGWRRAEIVDLDDKWMTLSLVDYGHRARLPRQDAHRLKELPEKLAALPALTHSCALRGVEPVGGLQWSDAAVAFFRACLRGGGLHLVFRRQVSRARWGVDVFLGGGNVARAMCEAGHASYLDAVLGIRFWQDPGRASWEHRTSEWQRWRRAEDTLIRSRRESETEYWPGLGVRRPQTDLPSSLRKCRVM